MKPFEFYQPASVAEAIEALGKHGEGARPIAGGTDLVVQMEEAGREFAALVDMTHIAELAEISDKDGAVRIGAGASLGSVAAHESVRAHAHALAQSAGIVGSVQIRNLATLAGNICNASPSADTSPALLALDAKIVIAGAGGERAVAVGEFFTGPGKTVVEPGEIVVRIEVPHAAPRSGSAYERLTPRQAMDIAIVGVASAVTLEEDGKTVASAKISLGAVAATPIRATEAEGLLAGKELDDDALRAAGEAAAAAAKPIDDLRATADYRRQMVDVLTRRTLIDAAANAKS